MWIEKIVGDLEDKKRYRQHKARMKALPPAYREAARGLERYVLYFGPTNDGNNLLTMLHDLGDLMEQSARDRVGIRDLVGEDPVEFAETFIANYGGGSWITKERARLAEQIDRAVEEENR